MRTRISAENIPLRSPDRPKFKRDPPTPSPPSRRFILDKEPSGPKIRAPISANQPTREEDTGLVVPREPPSPSSPIVASKAIPRRNDWTPPRNTTTEAVTPVVDQTSAQTSAEERAFPAGFMRSFTFEDQGLALPSTQKATIDPTSRRRIELLNGLRPEPHSKAKAKKSGARERDSTTVRQRKKSPAKKAMTITNLVTSNYFGQTDGQDESPMMQYLTATQAQTLNDEGDSHGRLDVALTRQKSKSSKTTAQKAKRKVTSPSTALKALEAQEAIFGSASQLAKSDPDTIEPHITPAPTQQTAPLSIESTTPKSMRGTSRYLKSRNLWSVSARDDDNALLYGDLADPTDTPVPKKTLAGKDGVVHAAATGPRSSLRGGGASPFDIDDYSSILLPQQFPTFKLPATRAMHTSNREGSPKKDQNAHDEASPKEQRLEVLKHPPEAAEELASDQKPSFGELSTPDLQQQLSSYGFKPVKKRERMIAILEKQWNEEHGVAATTPEEGSAILRKHGDFLSNLHDIASRPQPKLKKPRKRKSEEVSAGDAVLKKATKRARKVKDPNAPKPEPKKRAPKKKKDAVEQPGEVVIDVDAAVDPDVVQEMKPEPKKRGRKKKAELGGETRPEILDVDEAVLSTIVQVEAKTKKRSRQKTMPAPPADAPIPSPTKISAATAIETAADTVKIKSSSSAEEDPSRMDSDSIGYKIRAAIMRESADSAGSGRDHVKDPTWHEKMLMYDPIVLEDLATWLNTKGLALVDEDEEVSALQVRDWCESNGVCCLWRGGWRGQKGKAAED